MEEVLLFGTIISPIILAFTELFKVTLFNEAVGGDKVKRFTPIIAVVIGIFVGYFSQPFSDLDTELRIWSGILSGLSAVGMFEFIKGSTRKEGK